MIDIIILQPMLISCLCETKQVSDKLRCFSYVSVSIFLYFRNNSATVKWHRE